MTTRKITPSKTNKFKLLSKDTLSYLAGFIDGDGSIGAQITFSKNRKDFFGVRVSIGFHQHKDRAWFLYWIGKTLNTGSISKRKSSKWDWTIYSQNDVKDLLIVLLPYLRIKRKLAFIVIDIVNSNKNVENRADLIKVMKKVDETAFHTYSKRRLWTSLNAIKYWETGIYPEYSNSNSL